MRLNIKYVSELGVVVTFVAIAGLFGQTQEATKTTSQTSQDTVAPSGNSVAGKKLFATVGCYSCHGREAQGGSAYGPRLAPVPIAYPAFQAYVRKPAGEMPPYRDRILSDGQLADIYAFLKSQPRPKTADSISILK